MTTYTITMAEAVEAYRAGNNRGDGYAPFEGEAADDSIDAAIDAAKADGWSLVHDRNTSDDVAVLRSGDDWMAIGGDAMGHGAWAVDITAAAEVQS